MKDKSKKKTASTPSKKVKEEVNPFTDDEGWDIFSQELEAALRALNEVPGEDKRDKIVIEDISSNYDIEGEPVRVEMRRTHDPLGEKVPPGRRIVESNYLIGLVDSTNLPQEGKPFNMTHHTYNGKVDFSSVTTSGPIRDLTIEGEFYYFSTDEGDWRVEIVSGN